MYCTHVLQLYTHTLYVHIHPIMYTAAVRVNFHYTRTQLLVHLVLASVYNTFIIRACICTCICYTDMSTGSYGVSLGGKQ